MNATRRNRPRLSARAAGGLRAWRGAAGAFGVCLAVAMAQGHYAFAREPGRDARAVSMERAVRAAAAHHPAIAQATGVMRQMREQIEVARAGYLPKIQAGVSSAAASGGGQNWRPTLGVSASQMIYDFGKVASQVDAATAGARASEADVAATVDSVARDAALAFIEAQRYQALLAVAIQQEEGVRAIGALVERRAVAGASTRSDSEQAKARELATIVTREEIEGERARWLANLSYLSGLKVGSVSAAAPAALARACAAGEPDWSRVPAAVAAEQRRRKALAELEHSKASLYPTLSLSGSAEYDPFYERDRDYSYYNSSQNRRFSYSGGLKLSGDLYEGGANIARRRAADHALTAAMAADANVRLQVRQALAEARARARAILAQQKSVRLREEAMVKTRDLYRQQYVDLGTRTLLDLLNAEQELYTVRFQAVNLVHDLRRLQVECLHNTGMTPAVFRLAQEKRP